MPVAQAQDQDESAGRQRERVRAGNPQEAETDAADQQDEGEQLNELLQQMLNRQPESIAESQDVNVVFKGEGRQQNQLNPEISVTGDFFGSMTSSENKMIIEPGDFTDGRNYFNLRDVGFHFIAPLDPFTRGKFFLGLPGSGEDPLSEMIEEAYMEWLNPVGGMNLKVGKFFSQFGILNRYHEHGLPQVDRPRVLSSLFGNGNLGGFGIAGNFILPGLWAHVNEVDIEFMTSGDGYTFDDAYNNVFGVLHLKNYYDLTSDTYLEIGFSGAYGYNDREDKLATTLAGADVTCKWVPAGQSHYKTIELRSEVVFSRREEAAGDLDRFGFYTYLTSKQGARHWVGLRYGYTELPFSLDKQSEWDISPTIDFWQSEFVMWRAQYSFTSRDYSEDDNSVFLQAVWSMGPHKHEAY